MASSLSWSAAPSIEIFSQWLDKRDIKRHSSLSMAPMSPHSSGFRIVSSAPVPLGSILCAVPKSAIFSHQTASLDLAAIPSLAKDPESSAEVVFRLAACLLHELRLGKESPWFGWLQVLPRETIKVPILWDEPEIGGQDGLEGLRWLAGTDAERELKRQNEQDGLTKDGLRDFFSTLDLPVTPSHLFPPLYPDFLYAFSLISSRAFMLDTYHQIGIPPYCDMFNHSSTSSHTSLLCDAGVCPECGSLLRCPHDGGPPSAQPDRLAHVEPEYLAALEAAGQGDQVDMRAERDIAAGVEVFSCYEEGLKSAKALVGYQFVPAEPTGSRVNWSAREILHPDSAGLFVEISQRGRVAERIFGEAGGEGTKGTGLFRPGANAEQGGVDFSMDGDGTLSIDIFVALYICSAMRLGVDFDSLEELEEAIIRVEGALGVEMELGVVRGESQPGGDESGVGAAVLGEMVELLKERLAGMYRAEVTPEGIEDEIRGLPTASSLQRQAMSFSLDERRLLRAAIERLRDLGYRIR